MSASEKSTSVFEKIRTDFLRKDRQYWNCSHESINDVIKLCILIPNPLHKHVLVLEQSMKVFSIHGRMKKKNKISHILLRTLAFWYDHFENKNITTDRFIQIQQRPMKIHDACDSDRITE